MEWLQPMTNFWAIRLSEEQDRQTDRTWLQLHRSLEALCCLCQLRHPSAQFLALVLSLSPGKGNVIRPAMAQIEEVAATEGRGQADMYRDEMPVASW